MVEFLIMLAIALIVVAVIVMAIREDLAHDKSFAEIMKKDREQFLASEGRVYDIWFILVENLEVRKLGPFIATFDSVWEYSAPSTGLDNAEHCLKKSYALGYFTDNEKNTYPVSQIHKAWIQERK